MKNLQTFDEFINEGYGDYSDDESFQSKEFTFAWFRAIIGNMRLKEDDFNQESDVVKMLMKDRDIKSAIRTTEKSKGEKWFKSGFEEPLRIALAAVARDSKFFRHQDAIISNDKLYWMEAAKFFTGRGDKFFESPLVKRYKTELKSHKDFLKYLKDIRDKQNPSNIEPEGGYKGNLDIKTMKHRQYKTP